MQATLVKNGGETIKACVQKMYHELPQNPLFDHIKGTPPYAMKAKPAPGPCTAFIQSQTKRQLTSCPPVQKTFVPVKASFVTSRLKSLMKDNSFYMHFSTNKILQSTNFKSRSKKNLCSTTGLGSKSSLLKRLDTTSKRSKTNSTQKITRKCKSQGKKSILKSFLSSNSSLGQSYLNDKTSSMSRNYHVFTANDKPKTNCITEDLMTVNEIVKSRLMNYYKPNVESKPSVKQSFKQSLESIYGNGNLPAQRTSHQFRNTEKLHNCKVVSSNLNLMAKRPRVLSQDHRKDEDSRDFQNYIQYLKGTLKRPATSFRIKRDMVSIESLEPTRYIWRNSNHVTCSFKDDYLDVSKFQKLSKSSTENPMEKFSTPISRDNGNVSSKNRCFAPRRAKKIAVYF